MSDHKPVSAVLDCGIKIIDTVRYRKIYEEVMKKLDKLENEFLPQVLFSSLLFSLSLSLFFFSLFYI